MSTASVRSHGLKNCVTFHVRLERNCCSYVPFFMRALHTPFLGWLYFPEMKADLPRVLVSVPHNSVLEGVDLYFQIFRNRRFSHIFKWSFLQKYAHDPFVFFCLGIGYAIHKLLTKWILIHPICNTRDMAKIWHWLTSWIARGEMLRIERLWRCYFMCFNSAPIFYYEFDQTSDVTRRR